MKLNLKPFIYMYLFNYNQIKINKKYILYLNRGLETIFEFFRNGF